VRRLRTSGRSVVGLDIEPGHVTAVEAHEVDGALVVQRAVSAPLEPGVMRDGEVTDVEGLGEALRELFRDTKLARRVRIGVANQRIVVRTVDMPPIENAKELAAAVHFGAQDHIPMPLDQAVVEHVSLGIVETPAGPRTRVVLVAARRDMVEKLVSAVEEAGLHAVGVDLSAFAMIRALGGDHADPAPTLYVSVGGVTNLALAEGGRCLFNRVVSGGTELLAQDLAERRGLTLVDAHACLVHVGLTAEPADIEGDPEIIADARTVLTDGVQRIADAIRNSLDFYRSQDGGAGVDRAVVTGQALAIPGFTEALASVVGLTVHAGVLAAVESDTGRDIEPGQLVVAAGLAVEELAA
jgi:type IV pilus assembly protein PilM